MASPLPDRALVKKNFWVCRCLRCGWEWQSALYAAFLEKPKKCPKCGSVGWDREYRYKTYRGKPHEIKRREEK